MTAKKNYVIRLSSKTNFFNRFGRNQLRFYTKKQKNRLLKPFFQGAVSRIQGVMLGTFNLLRIGRGL